MLADVGRMTLRQGKLWLSGQDGQLLNALDADGRVRNSGRGPQRGRHRLFDYEPW